MKNKILIGLVVVAIIVAARLLPHAPNFAPIASLALFVSTVWNRKFGFLAVIFGMLLSDMIVGFYEPMVMVFNYAGLLSALLLSGFVKTSMYSGSKSLKAILGCSLAGSLLFFALSNFGVWAFSGMYTHNAAGMLTCYTYAVPFIKGSVMGDLFYNSLFFGAYFILAHFYSKKLTLIDKG